MHVPKGAAVVKVNMLQRHPNTSDKFFLPLNSKTVNFPITDLIYPSSLQDRNTYIGYTTSETTHTNYKMKTSIQIIYIIDDSSMNNLIAQFEM